jgi:capsular polysaccharide export protein
LQVSSDSQIVKGSKIKDNYQFIQKVIQKFAEAKLDNFNLVFKHHPRDRGYINYSKFIKENSKKMHIQNQVFYIHDYFLSKIFKNNLCKGTVLINSSVGYQSLFHSVPVKAIGIAPYNIEELADQKDLKSFFKKPSEVNVLLFSKFYRYVLENSQINGNFDGFFPFESVFEIQNK